MKLQTIILILTLAFAAWQLLTFWRPHLKTRVSRALHVGIAAYLLIIVVRLATSPIDQDQLEAAGLSLALFGGVWAVAWLIARSQAGGR